MSLDILQDKSKNLTDLAHDIVRGYLAYFQQYGEKFNYQNNKAKEFLGYLIGLRNEMENLFSDETIEEKEIDKFLQNNQFVLDQCLNLIYIIPQVELKDTLNKYGQDLKPDLLGYDQDRKQWTIVDYKRAKRSIIKSRGRVRVNFKAEVYDLESQLRDCREYFNEESNRSFVKQKYDYIIEFPSTIGIIGNVSMEEERDFNRACEDLPRWVEILPYNYLLGKFVRFIGTIERFA